MAATYAERKKQINEIQAAQSLAGRDIGDIPAVVDPKRRESCRLNFQRFCETYFPAAFYLGFSADHLKVIRIIQDSVLSGGLFAVAMPRGSGKSTLCRAAVLWSVLYGHRSYVVLIGASEDAAVEELDKIKAELDGTSNVELAADFPEVVYPIQSLEGMVQRTKGQHSNGTRTQIDWTAKRLTLPTVSGSKASGSVIGVAGLTGRIRGLAVNKAGEIVRPDFAILDDPSTDESAHSPEQNRKRLNIVNGAILGLAGPGKKIAGVCPCTVIARDDLADKLLDRKRYPEWQGSRTRLMVSMPTEVKLWEQYAEIRATDLRDDSIPGSDKLKRATAFYEANRQAMDKDAVSSWPERYNADEVSAVQHAMNLRLRSPETFAAEYQNEPISNEVETPLLLKPDGIYRKIIPGLARNVVPDWATKLTAFVDVQGSILFYCVAAWGNDYTGHVIDYGTYPEQPRISFTLREVTRTLAKVHPSLGKEGTLRAGLEKLTASLLGKVFYTQSGNEKAISRLLIDSGWDDGSGVVKQFCKDSTHRALILPSKGFGKGPEARPLNEWQQRTGERAGWNWRVTPEHCLYDTNAYKTFVAGNLNLSTADPGNLSLFNESELRHQMFAAHVTSEFPTLVEANGRSLNVWRKRPNTENHLYDCLIGCAVGASEQGILAVGHMPATGEEKKKGRKFKVRF